MGRKKQISDQRRLYTERMRLQKGVFSSLANAAGHIGELYADFVQSDEVRNSMRATADKVTECMDGIRELNELEWQEYHQECEKKKMVYSKSVLPWRARDTVPMVAAQRNVRRMSSGSVRKLRQVCIIPTKI